MRIEAADRAGRERLLRYCARLPCALERLREFDPERLLYEAVKLGPGQHDRLLLTPLELIDRIATLVPPPRKHRHRYFGALPPNSPLRAARAAYTLTRGITPQGGRKDAPRRRPTTQSAGRSRRANP